MTLLHHIGEFLRLALGAIPLPWVRLFFVVCLVALLIWVLRLPRSATTPEGGTDRWDENLKVGASLALIIQIVIYSLV